MKRILGLDLGTNSIGWAHVIEDNNGNNSSIVDIGVRVNPLTSEELKNFEKGKPVSINAERTLKRGARRNLDRFQLRRKYLLELLLNQGWISHDTPLAEVGKHSTFELLSLRAKAANERVELSEFARILLSINKKRGYKSSRKAKNEDDGLIIDGMDIAKRMHEENLTPGQLAYELLKQGKKKLPDFYRSDLEAELAQVWKVQASAHPSIFTDAFRKDIEGKGQKATSATFYGTYGLNTAENKGNREEKKLQAYKWRADAIHEPLAKEEAAYVISEINRDLYNSSGYLGAISDRSKELYFKRLTIGQYLYNQIKQDPHAQLKNQVFYRQDYMDEFEKLWQTQSTFHPQLTEELKSEIRDVIIFYQRPLKSAKHLVSFCQFERKEVELRSTEKAIQKDDGAIKKKTIGLKVAPKSSPLFQEFKIWQVLANFEVKKKTTKEWTQLDLEAKEALFEELNLKGNLPVLRCLEIIGLSPNEFDTNYKTLEGNRTNQLLYSAYFKILEIEGYDIKEILQVKSNKDEVILSEVEVPAIDIKNMVRDMFNSLKIDSSILDFDAEAEGKAFEDQSAYRLWHLIYSSQDDTNPPSEEETLIYGQHNVQLKKQLCQKFGFSPEHAKILVEVTFTDDYGSLSSKAIRKIYPHIKELQFDKAAALAGYNHSNSLTKEENEKRELKPFLKLLPKNSLRNPVVEKILNQMVNLINELITKNSEKNQEGKIIAPFHFDEIRIELARELKMNREDRAQMTAEIERASRRHEGITRILQKDFGILSPSRNDIIRYKLYQELKNNGYKDLYTDTYIRRDQLFTKEIDIEHIIPQARLFDNSFSNKTLCWRTDNLHKANRTAYDYILDQYGEKGMEEYKSRITSLYESRKKSKDDPEAGISRSKYQKLLKQSKDIGEGFIERDIKNTQYIAKKAKSMLLEISRRVTPTSGKITDRLRQDWGLVNLMQELNLDKYKSIGQTTFIIKKDGSKKEVIQDWTKRNDHRHHAMDALTTAFTKSSFIQYLNNLHARENERLIKQKNILTIEAKELYKFKDDQGNYKWIFKEPIPNFRQVVKPFLESILVSHKAKNKVTTRNKNIHKTANGEKTLTQETPRGQLHKETIYGKYHYYQSKEVKIGSKFDKETIQKVSKPIYRHALLQRLKANGNDPKKAFAGKNTPSKNPIIYDEKLQLALPEKVKLVWLEEGFSIRKEIVGSNPTSRQFIPDYKSIDKILDEKIKNILKNRLDKYNGNPKEAFSNLDKNPIYLNKKKGITIKRVTISGVNNAESLHYSKDHLGNLILDSKGHPIPVDYVQTGNNHHVAIYQDEKGDLQEMVVSFMEAVRRKKANEPIIEMEYNKNLGWKFLFSMKQNELFLFPNKEFDPSEIDPRDPTNKTTISPNLFRVQKLASKNYMFRHHLETELIDKKETRGVTWENIRSTNGLKGIVKVRVNHLGYIVHTGEY